jgi:branched-subunit amino acid ABC-type transport system permease component
MRRCAHLGAGSAHAQSAEALAGPVEIGDFFYPAYRLLIIAFGIAIAGLLYLLVAKSRVGMWVRAGAANREMTEALGINVRGLFTAVFVFGAALCALAGGLLGPLLAVQVGMGESVLILAFVVIIIGGIGSIRGALVGSLIVGTVDTLGRALLPTLLRATLPADAASTLGPALASILIYLLMAGILFFKPQGLFRRAQWLSTARFLAEAALLLLLCAALALPSALAAFGQEFYIGFATRVLIFALAASSLNLVLGFGGMVSLGHAAFLGAGAYAAAICQQAGINEALLAFPPPWASPGCSRWSSAPSACARVASISS